MKKSQIANHFFVTKATDLNVYFEKPLKNVCRDMCHTFKFFKEKLLHFFTLFLAFFSTLYPKLSKLSSNFFQ